MRTPGHHHCPCCALRAALTEDAIRKNVVLVYELLDEVVDYGYPQSTATEALKQFVINEPTVVTPAYYSGKPLFSLSKGPTGVFKSVLETTRSDGKRRDEIFVDVVERLTCTFNASGYIASSQVRPCTNCVWCVRTGACVHVCCGAGWR